MAKKNAKKPEPSDRDDGPFIVSYTREQAIADGVLIPVGLVGTQRGRFIGVCFTAHLFEAFKDPKKRRRLVEEGLDALRKPDPEDTPHRRLRVLRGKYWVILDGDGITFLYPEDY